MRRLNNTSGVSSKIVLIAAAFGLFPSQLAAQFNNYTNLTGGFTPPAMASGSPAGSYALSDVDTIDYYTGAINVAVPLLRIGGRGDDGYTMVLPLGAHWKFENHPNGNAPVYVPIPSVSPYSGTSPYAQGFMHIRQVTNLIPDSGGGTFVCNSSGVTYLDGQTLTRVSWIGPDGTEHDLYDTQSGGGGAPTPSANYTCATDPNAGGTNRGQIFKSRDADSLVFISDAPIYDAITTQTYGIRQLHSGASGWLFFPNGSKLQFAGGAVAQRVDRNGNTTTFSQPDANGNYSVTDSIGRTTKIAYGGGTTGSPDIITLAESAELPTGPPRTIIVNYSSLDQLLPSGTVPQNIATLFPTSNGSNSTPFDPDLVSSIILPDGVSSYTFGYNVYGEVTQITLPTGGVIKYAYPGAPQFCSSFSTSVYTCAEVIAMSDSTNMAMIRRVMSRSTYPDGVTLEGTANFTPLYRTIDALNLYSGTGTQVDRMDASGNPLSTEKHYMIGDISSLSEFAGAPDQWAADALHGKEYQTDVFNSPSSATALNSTYLIWYENQVNTSQTAYTYDPHVCQATETRDGAIRSARLFAYDSFNNTTDIYEYGYGTAPAAASPCPAAPGNFLRHTNTSFVPSGYDSIGTNSATSWHLVNLPTDTLVTDAQGKRAETQFSYDLSTSPVLAESSPSGYTAPPVGAPRGNLNTVSRWYNKTGGFLTKTYQYDILGNVISWNDEDGHATTYTYADSFSNGVTTLQRGITSYGFATGITNALGQKTSLSFDYFLGSVTSLIDPNGTTTALGYYPDPNTSTVPDPFHRLISVRKAAGVPGIETDTKYSYPTLTVTSRHNDLLATGDGALVTTTTTDGFGRPKETQIFEGGGVYTEVDTLYDGMGRANQVSLPHRTTPASPGPPPVAAMAEPTVYIKTTFDGLSRPLTVSNLGDLSSTVTSYSGDSSGSVATVTDPASVKRAMSFDPAGRLVQVIENGTATTTYAFDGLDSLTGVNQSGLLRTFVWDSLGRLGSATNPESGTVTYSYDNAGNLTGRSDQRVVAGNLALSATYGYDALNRLNSKTYNDSQTATVNYTYDDPAVPNSIGRATKSTAGALLSQVTAYDALGRVTGSSQTTGSASAYTFAYSYYLNDAIKTMTYPSQRIVTTTPDGAGRPSQIDGTGASHSYVSSVAYASHGAVRQMTLGNGLTETTTFDQGMFTQRQPTQVAVSGVTNPLTLQYGYCNGGAAKCASNNGNVWQQQIGIVDLVNGAQTPSNWTQNYTYTDGLNRIGGMTDSGGTGQGFGYDVFGNRAVTSGYTSPNGHTPTSLADYTATNRLSGAFGAVYDAAGNVTAMVGDAFQYDAESRMTQSNVQNTGAVNYIYDGDGKRVMKFYVSGTQTVTFTYVYDAFGNLAAEHSTAGATDAGTSYLTSDILGSTRMITGDGGVVKKRYDYFPFGEYIPSGTGGRSSNYAAGTFPAVTDVASLKFTGGERDEETGLDFFQARYLNAGQGRFQGADPGQVGADLGDPQTWNGYSYVRNNPFVFVDPSGMFLEQQTGPQTGRNPEDQQPEDQQPWGGPGFVFFGQIGGPANQPLNPPGPKIIGFAAPSKIPSSTACQNKIANALNSNLQPNTNVMFLGPTVIPPSQMDPRLGPGGRNGAYNFNYFAPGVNNPLAGSTNGSGRFPGSGLHVPLPGGADPVIPNFGPGVYMGQNGSFLTAHFDSGNPFDDLVSFFQHIINDVLGRNPHGC